MCMHFFILILFIVQTTFTLLQINEILLCVYLYHWFVINKKKYIISDFAKSVWDFWRPFIQTSVSNSILTYWALPFIG